MQEIGGGMNFSFWPNPASDQVMLSIDGPATGAIYSIIDQPGRTILSGTIEADQMTIDLDRMPAGAYELQVALDGSSRHARLIIQ